jgi:integrase
MRTGIKNPRLAKSSRSPNWEIAFTEYVDGRPISRRVSTWTTDRLAAEAALTGFLTGEERNAAVSASPLVTDLLDAYERHIDEENKGETQRICIMHLRAGFKHVRLSGLTPDAQRRYRQARGVAGPTLRRELGALRACLGYAKRHNMVTGDLPYIELPRASQSKETYLTRSQADVFLDLASKHSEGQPRLTRITRFVWLAMTTAARKQAITGLTWDRVDWDALTIDYQEPGLQLHNKRRVLVPIAKKLEPILRQAYEERTSDYVLDHPGSIRTAWETWIATTPFYFLNPHDCRRTWATLAAQAGVPLIDIAAILGDSVEIVIRHYAKHVPGAGRNAVDAF